MYVCMNESMNPWDWDTYLICMYVYVACEKTKWSV